MDTFVDFLCVTFKADDDDVLSIARDLFGEFDFVEIRGSYGYQRALVLPGNGRLYFAGQPGMGVHVSLPSESLSCLRVGLDYFSVASVTRIDIAFDAQIDIRTIDWSCLVSRSRDVTRVEKVRGAPGLTVYVGSASSDTRVRVYDKSAEVGLSDVITRFEWQFRDDRAQAIYNVLMSGGSVLPYLLRYLDFRDICSTSNVSRAPRLSWWASIVGSLRSLPLLPVRVVRTLDDVKNWILRQVAPSLALLSMSSDFGDFLVSALAHGMSRLSSAKLALVYVPS